MGMAEVVPDPPRKVQGKTFKAITHDELEFHTSSGWQLDQTQPPQIDYVEIADAVRRSGYNQYSSYETIKLPQPLVIQRLRYLVWRPSEHVHALDHARQVEFQSQSTIINIEHQTARREDALKAELVKRFDTLEAAKRLGGDQALVEGVKALFAEVPAVVKR